MKRGRLYLVAVCFCILTVFCTACAGGAAPPSVPAEDGSPSDSVSSPFDTPPMKI